MKSSKLYLLLLLVTVLSSAIAAEAVKIEIRGEAIKTEGQMTIAKGNAVVVVDDITIFAEQIVADSASGELKCRGETTIKTAKFTIRTRDATLETKEVTPTTPLPTRKIRDLLTDRSLR